MKNLLKLLTFTLFFTLLLGWTSIVVSAEEPEELVEEEIQDLSISAQNTLVSEKLMQVRLRNYLGNQTTVPIKVNGTYRLAGDSKVTLQANKDYQIKVSSSNVQLFEGSTRLKTASSFTFIPETNNLSHYLFVDKRGYLGEMEFAVDTQTGFIRAINRIGLEDYLKSVVPHEMPASWGDDRNKGIEALKAQAVAARSYAVRRLGTVINDTQTFQVYGGYKIIDSSNRIVDVWHINSTNAVNATKGEVVLTGSIVAETLYSSSNGGTVESNHGAWGTTQLSYLVAKADPFDPKNQSTLSIDQQQLTPGDLGNPSSWWNSRSEKNVNIANRLKGSLANSYKTADDFKINAINGISFSNKNSGERYRNATFDFSFYMKDKDTLKINELQGKSRWDTNKAITQFGWKEQQDVVIIGRGDQSADALTGNVLAAKYNAPILLTRNDHFPSQMAEELTRFKPKTIYILGGRLAISDIVKERIAELAPSAEIIRIEGRNRYITSLEIAKEVNSSSKTIILAPAFDGKGVKESPDALTVGPYAGVNQIPIILTGKNSLRTEIKDYIVNNSINQVYILGGELVVAAEVENELKTLVNNVERIAGATRYETATKIAERFPLNNTKVFFTRGDDHTDALAAAPLATREQAPILLTRTKSVPAQVNSWLIKEKSNVKELNFLGGQLAMNDNTRHALKDTLLYRYNNNGTLQAFNEVVTVTSTNSEQLRSLFGMRSALLTSNKATLKDGKLTVGVLGWGHGVGMSQYGAYERAKAGQTYRQILEFYYPTTTIGIR